jgi:Sel1 repeat
MNNSKMITKKIAEDILSGGQDAKSYTSIEDAAAVMLAKARFRLSLSGLTTISDPSAEALAKHEGHSLDLSGLTTISDLSAEALAKNEGNLDLSGLTRLSDIAARDLAKHKGELALNGLKILNNAAAQSLAKHEGTLCLNGLVGLSATSATALARLDWDSPDKATFYTQGAAYRSLQQAESAKGAPLGTLKEVNYENPIEVFKEAQDQLDKKNDFDALRLYSFAADEGLAPAQYMVGRLHYTGRGVGKRNPEEAFRWFEMAANQGFQDAQFNLGAMYSEADGVARDDVESCKWFLVVVAKGDKEAAEILNMVARDLNKDEQATARRRAGEILAKEGLTEKLEAMDLGVGKPRSRNVGKVVFIFLGALAAVWIFYRLFSSKS